MYEKAEEWRIYLRNGRIEETRIGELNARCAECGEWRFWFVVFGREGNSPHLVYGSGLVTVVYIECMTSIRESSQVKSS